MNINKIIEEWVEEEAKKHKKVFMENQTDECVFALNMLQNLKSRIPQLTERIVEEIENEFDKYGATDTTREIYQSIKKDIIKSLTE